MGMVCKCLGQQVITVDIYLLLYEKYILPSSYQTVTLSSTTYSWHCCELTTIASADIPTCDTADRRGGRGSDGRGVACADRINNGLTSNDNSRLAGGHLGRLTTNDGPHKRHRRYVRASEPDQIGRDIYSGQLRRSLGVIDF